MKCPLFLCALGCLAYVLTSGVRAGKSAYFTEAELTEHFRTFKSDFKRVYATTEEETARKSVFAANLELILRHNLEKLRGQHSYSLGVNQFADLTNGEFHKQVVNWKGQLGSSGTESNVAPTTTTSTTTLPVTVDYVSKGGVVTPVKDQGVSGSSVPFAAVASIEGVHALKTHTLVALSEQQIVDCCGNTAGDNTGLPENEPFKCILKLGGLNRLESYPDPSTSSTPSGCRFSNASTTAIGATLASFVALKSGDESALQSAVAQFGPVMVGVNGALATFQFYQSGVYDDPNCTDSVTESSGASTSAINHAITVIGYGTPTDPTGTAAEPYWKAKNSWGTQWGEAGFVRIARNRQNLCGIASQAIYPVV